MANDEFKKVAPGDKLNVPARTYNAFIDAALAERARKSGQGGGTVYDGADATIVQVKNGTGDTVPKFGVLGFTDTAVIDPADDEDSFIAHKAALDGRIPIIPDDAGRFAVTLEESDDGEFVNAVIIGVVRCKVDVGAEGDKFAEAVDGDVTKLESSGTGTAAQILWKEAGTGVKWAVVRIGAGQGESIGQYKYMIHQMVAQNVSGWNWGLAHPPQI